MSVSLYYTAEREHLISEQEKADCQKIIEDYIKDYPLGDIYEEFCVYDTKDSDGDNVIFEGSTKLPLDDGVEHCNEVLAYWAECLQEIIDVLHGAQWSINVDDADITEHFDYPDEGGN